VEDISEGALNGAPYCKDCPDHEACMTGFPCSMVKDVAEKWKDGPPKPQKEQNE
jgi:hypothetical protein